TEIDTGTLNFMTSIMFKGSKNYPPVQLSEWIEDNSITLEASANFLGIYIEFSCLSNDFSQLINVITDILNKPLFDQKEIDLAKNRAYANYMRKLNNPDSYHTEFRNSKIYTSKREQLTNEEEFNIISNLTKKDLLSAYKKYITAENITLSLIGDIEFNEAKKIAQKIKSDIPNKKVNDTLKSLQMIVSDSLFINYYDFEQVNLDINMKAPDISNRKDFIIMQVISSILNGSRGRIHEAVRGNNDLAYFAFASYIYGYDYGILRLSSQTSLEKENELIEVLIDQINKLKTEPVSKNEINLAIEDNYKTIKNYLEDEYLAYYSLYNEIIGLGYDYFETSLNELKEVNSEDIIRVANQYFDKMDIIVSKPVTE
ncbi:MAG: pitrilysin family protein, partial [Candidatus Cloacimonetes bacterium]|nr:pitrilysin family protein [Candidatus Cloacimonadota bacterium]